MHVMWDLGMPSKVRYLAFKPGSGLLLTIGKHLVPRSKLGGVHLLGGGAPLVQTVERRTGQSDSSRNLEFKE